MGCTYHPHRHHQAVFGHHHHHHRPHHHRVICLVRARGTIRAWRYTYNSAIIISIITTMIMSMMIIVVMKKMLVFWTLQKDSDLNFTASNNSDDNIISNVKLKFSLQLM